MKDQYGFNRARLDNAEVISVICVKLTEGKGGDDDPVRQVKYYYALDGEFLAEYDPCIT